MLGKACSYPGCTGLADKGSMCSTHRSEYLKQRDAGAPSWSRWYSTGLWQRLRAVVIAEEPFCQAEGCNTQTQHVDHITPHRGDWELFTRRSNLQGLCASCHYAKSDRERGG